MQAKGMRLNKQADFVVGSVTGCKSAHSSLQLAISSVGTSNLAMISILTLITRAVISRFAIAPLDVVKIR